jgi:hypothetical protein
VGASESDVTEPVAAEAGAPKVVDAGLTCPFGAPAETGRPRPARRGYLLPGLIALFVCAAVAIVFDLTGLQSHNPKRLAGSEVETFLAQAVQAGHPQSSPPQVHCPGSEPLRAGVVFSCTMTRTGRGPATIRVTETSSAGVFHYKVLSSG